MSLLIFVGEKPASKSPMTILLQYLQVPLDVEALMMAFSAGKIHKFPPSIHVQRYSSDKESSGRRRGCSDHGALEIGISQKDGPPLFSQEILDIIS